MLWANFTILFRWQTKSVNFLEFSFNYALFFRVIVLVKLFLRWFLENILDEFNVLDFSAKIWFILFFKFLHTLYIVFFLEYFKLIIQVFVILVRNSIHWNCKKTEKTSTVYQISHQTITTIDIQITSKKRKCIQTQLPDH